MAHLCPPLQFVQFTSNGLPLAGGKVHTYAAGTSTPLATYTDQSEATPNANPVILDANGKASIWIGSSSYKFVVMNSADVEQFTKDNVTHLGNGSVTEATIADGAVTEEKIADFAVTPDKLSAMDIRTQALTITPVSNTTPQVVTGTLNITTTGRPVSVGLIGQDSAGTPAKFKVSGPIGTPVIGRIDIYRGATLITSEQFGVEKSGVGTVVAEYDGAGEYEYTPATDRYVDVLACGGGGGGGGCTAHNYPGGGGGGGGAAGMSRVLLEGGETYTITVGVAGTAGTSGTSGGAGGDTKIEDSLGNILVLYRGGRGGFRSSTVSGTNSAGGQAWGRGPMYSSGGAGGDGGSGGGGATAGDGGEEVGISVGFGPGNGGLSDGIGRAGGGGGGASLGQGGNGSDYDTTNGTAGVRGGGGGGAGANASGTSGFAGGVGYIQITDANSGLSGDIAAYLPPSAIRFEDEGATEGTHNYTIRIGVSNAAATIEATGLISLQAFEL